MRERQRDTKHRLLVSLLVNLKVEMYFGNVLNPDIPLDVAAGRFSESFQSVYIPT